MVNPVLARRLRSALETAATVAMLIAACAIVWRVRAANQPTPRPTTQARPPIPIPAEPVSLAGAQMRGNRSARVAMIEYADFQCPFCGRFTTDTLPELERKYVDTGLVLFAFRHLPLSMHPFARSAAQAAECAGLQGQFWQMSARLFGDQAHLDSVSLREKATALGLKPSLFESCLSGPTAASIERDAASAQSLQLTGTPTFVFGDLLGDGRVKVRKIIASALTAGQADAVVKTLMSPR
jgi:protein-disulfide isomerase